MPLVGRVLPDGIVGELEVDVADKLAITPAPSDGRTAWEAHTPLTTLDAILEGALELVAMTSRQGYVRRVCWYEVVRRPTTHRVGRMRYKLRLDAVGTAFIILMGFSFFLLDPMYLKGGYLLAFL